MADTAAEKAKRERERHGSEASGMYKLFCKYFMPRLMYFDLYYDASYVFI